MKWRLALSVFALALNSVATATATATATAAAAAAAAAAAGGGGNAFEFRVDYENDCFLKDGSPFQVISGSVHYYNVPEALWQDRLRSMKMCGVNTVQTYVEWRTLEPCNECFDFAGQNNISRFVEIAHSVGLLVNIRLGPYIDSEREMGGLPWWLLQINPDMRLRASGGEFLRYVARFWQRLLPHLRPLLYSNGGPIILVQIENEYGSYSACDFVYTAALRDLATSTLGEDVVYYTTDGAGDSFLKCGKNEGLFSTVDFGVGANFRSSFESQRRHQRRGPLVNSEFYTGWLDHWGEAHHTVDASTVARSLDTMLAMNASVNMYMFHGGTHFGFSNGANLGSSYQPCPTSYDYDAPLNEAGDPTDKFFAIKSVIKKYAPDVPDDNPVPKRKAAYGDVSLRRSLDLETGLEFLKALHTPETTTNPLSFETLGQGYGLVAYEVQIAFRPFSPSVLKVPGLKDRGYVYVDYELVGILSREVNSYEIPLSIELNQTLTILVENQGRVCFGDGIADLKGIVQPVKLGNHILKHWKNIPLPYTNEGGNNFHLWTSFVVDDLQEKNPVRLRTLKGFAAYEGMFTIPNSNGNPLDTYLKLEGWTKGFVFVNDRNLGRYWPNQGPQVTLYVPSCFLRLGLNKVGVVELEKAPSNMTVSFVNEPQLAGPVPQ